MKQLCAMMVLCGMQLLGATRPGMQVATTEWDNVLPQIADGAEWSTRIMLVNMGTVEAPYTLTFFNQDGTPWNIAFKGIAAGPSSSWTGTIPIGGSLFLETSAAASVVNQGWALLATQNWISGMAVFRQALGPAGESEAVVPFASEVDVDFFIPFDNRNGYVTSIALVNPSQTGTANISVQFRNPDGTVIPLRKTDGTVVQTDIIALEPLHHTAFETTNKYPETIGKNGVIEFLVPDEPAFASGLGLLFLPSHTFTSIHSVSIDPYLFQ